MPNPLRTWIYKAKNFERISILAILGGLAVIALAWFTVAKIIQKQAEQVYFNNVQNLEVRTYSLNGKIKNLNLPLIEFEVGQVVTGKDGNTLAYKTYTTSTNSNTKYFKRTPEKTFAPGTIEDLSPDSSITVYTEQNPFEVDKFSASKIEID